jgi:phosphoribosylglycinamide formyltransferase 1
LARRAIVMTRLSLGILGSGKGSNFVAIAQAIAAGTLPAEIRLVVSDNPGAGILAHAQKMGLPTRLLPPSRFRTKLEPEIEHQLAGWLREAGVEWVILAGYMRVVKAPLLEAYSHRILNIHPSLLPAFRGLEAWRQALEAGVAVTGCTVHEVNAEIDGGRVLAQREVLVQAGDTPETLHARIQAAEHALFPEVLRQLAAQGGHWAKEASLAGPP